MERLKASVQGKGRGKVQEAVRRRMGKEVQTRGYPSGKLRVHLSAGLCTERKCCSEGRLTSTVGAPCCLYASGMASAGAARATAAGTAATTVRARRRFMVVCGINSSCLVLPQGLPTEEWREAYKA